MTTASLAVDQGEDRPTLWLKLIAFGGRAEDLAAHHKGDSLSVVGRLQLSEWQDREGTTRQTLELVVDTLVSARRSPRREAPAQEPRPRPPPRTAGPADAEFNDELTF
jgi:single-stranded DNA-binding protein